MADAALPPPAAAPAWPTLAPVLQHWAGVGLKPQHFEDISTDPEHRPGWFEIHPENYMGVGGAMLAGLDRIAALWPISMHGVGMSLGSIEGIDETHLERFAALVERFEPILVSEHLSWSRIGGRFIPDLLPLPLTDEALAVMADNVDRMQARLKRRVLIENPSTYLETSRADYDEPSFMAELCRRTGCGWLLDVNNVVVACTNHGRDAEAYIDRVHGELVGEIHLAGHAVEAHPDGPLLIDDHGSAVGPDCWRLFERLIARIGPRPTLIEWDTEVPEWHVLRDEAAKAERRMLAIETRHAA